MNRIAGLLLTLVLVGSVAVAVTRPANAVVNNPAQEIAIGVSVDRDSLASIRAFESGIGRQLDVVRVFKNWHEPFPTADEQTMLDEGRDLILSVGPGDPNQTITWSNIATASPGHSLHADMVSWADRVRPYQDQIHLAFHHEPETVGNIPKGSSADFIAAWRNFMGVFADQGVVPKNRVWIMTDYSFQVRSTDRRAAFRWYPGDAWVDAIAADAYNWHDCRPGINVPWRSLGANIEALRVFGAAHPDKELMLAEIGSAEDETDPGRKAEWIGDMADLFKQPGYEQFSVISWFNLFHNGEPSVCDWRLSDGVGSLDAFAALADDPFYGGPGSPPGAEVFADRVDATNQTASSWVATNYTAATSGPHTFALRWNGPADLRFDLTQNGSWKASNLGASNPKTMSADLQAGATYRIAVWAPSGTADFSVSVGEESTPQGMIVATGARDAAEEVAPRWATIDYVPISSGSATLTADWSGLGILKFTARTSNGTWLGSATSNAGPKTVTIDVVAGQTYRIAVWSTWEHISFDLYSTIGEAQDGQTVMTGQVDSSRVGAPSWETTTFTAPFTGDALLTLEWGVAAADLRMEVRTAGGSWLGANLSGARPKTMSVPVVAGVTYRVNVWAVGGSAPYEVTARPG